MNQDERRTLLIVKEQLPKPVVESDFIRLKEMEKNFQAFLNSDYRKGLGNQKPYALAVAFSLWLKEKVK